MKNETTEIMLPINLGLLGMSEMGRFSRNKRDVKLGKEISTNDCKTWESKRWQQDL